MRRLGLCCWLGTVLVAALLTPHLNGAPEGQKKWNVILILSDDHRYDFMGFMGRPAFLETPSMDRMAAGGMHIRNAFVSTSLCSPSRASILTGQYAHRHGVVDNQRLIPPGTSFFPGLLQQAGYQTAFIGKWHMGQSKDDPRQGFDQWISYRGQGTYYDPTLNINGEREKKEGYTADIVTDYALDWLRKQQGTPFFLFLSHKSVHAMFEPAKRHLGRYETAQLEYPATMAATPENLAGRPAWVLKQRDSWHGVDYMYHGTMDFDTFYRRYTETLLGLDENIGRVLDFVDASDLKDSTIVIYMSDNGFSFGEHGLIDKRHMYEESIRVPMIVYAPGLVKAGSSTDHMIQNIDLAPTILALAGLPAPNEMDGRSFLPILEAKHVEWRDEILYEYYWEWNYPQTPTVLGLRGNQYKYIFYQGLWDQDEFFDLQNDPMETRNLIADPAFREKAQEYRTRLFRILEDTGGMTVPLREPAGYRADRQRPK